MTIHAVETASQCAALQQCERARLILRIAEIEQKLDEKEAELARLEQELESLRRQIEPPEYSRMDDIAC